MTKDETTMAIEKAGKKIENGVVKSPSDKDGIPQEIAEIKEEIKNEDKELNKISPKEETAEAKTEEKKKPVQKKEIAKKDHAIVNGVSLPISTKTSSAICRFIRGKSIEKAIADLEQVTMLKRAIPMRGEIPHRKGKGIMSGRYPIKAISYFVKMLKTLQANAVVNGVEDGIIVEAIPNRASLPYGRFGAIRRKRTHVKIKVAEKKTKAKKKNGKEKKK